MRTLSITKLGKCRGLIAATLVLLPVAACTEGPTEPAANQVDVASLAERLVAVEQANREQDLTPGLDDLANRLERLERRLGAGPEVASVPRNDRAAAVSPAAPPISLDTARLSSLTDRMGKLDRRLQVLEEQPRRFEDSPDAMPSSTVGFDSLRRTVDDVAHDVANLELRFATLELLARDARRAPDERRPGRIEFETVERAVSGLGRDVASLQRELNEVERITGTDRIPDAVRRVERTLDQIERELRNLTSRVRQLESKG